MGCLLNCVAFTATANNPDLCNEQSTGLCALKKGDQAPFLGILFNPTEAATAATLPGEIKDKCELAKINIKDMNLAEMQLLKEKHEIALQNANELINMYDKKLKEALNPPWYENKYLWLAGGFVVGSFMTFKVIEAAK